MTKKNTAYYFQICGIEYSAYFDQPFLALTKKIFFDKNKHLDDQERGKSITLPKSVGADLQEAMFELLEAPEKVRADMLKAGFVEKKMVSP